MVKYQALYEKAKNEMYERWENGKSALKAADYEPEISMVPRLDEINEKLADVELIYNEKDKVSAMLTLNKLRNTNEELFYLLLFISTYPRRAGLILDGDRFCSLVPPLMSAHKEFHDVQYEDWDKKDKGIALAVGVTLWHDIKKFLVPIPELDNNLAELRKPNMFIKGGTNKGKAKNLSGNAWANLRYGDQVISGKSLVLCIKGQFWKANVKTRNKYMILDTVNWDNIPKAFDTTEITDKVVKRKGDFDLPF